MLQSYSLLLYAPYRRQNANKENEFKLFTLESLSLETDCGYTRRPKLLGHGFSNTRLDDMFSDRSNVFHHTSL